MQQAIFLAMASSALAIIGITGVAQAQTIADGLNGSGNIPKAAYLQQCATALDLGGQPGTAIPTAPGRPITATTLNSRLYPANKLGCIRLSEDDVSYDAYAKAGQGMMNDIFNKLYPAGTGNLGLLQGTRDCFNEVNPFGQSLTDRVEVYAGRDLKTIGSQGVNMVNAGNLNSTFVLSVPNVDLKTLAGITVGRNVFLSAQPGDIDFKLMPSVPTGKTSKQVGSFTSNKTVRANLALLHGLFLAQRWATTFGQDASKLFYDEFYYFANQEDCRVENSHIEKYAYDFVTKNGGKFLCCLKTKQVGAMSG